MSIAISNKIEDKVENGLKKCPLCKHKVEVEIENGELVYDCEHCGLYIEETSTSTLVDFPSHNMIYIDVSMSRKEVKHKLFVLEKRFSRARKAYKKSKSSKSLQGSYREL